MTQELPLTIQNPTGETIIFKELIQEPDGDRLVVENYVSSKCGPPMHTHFLQDEQLTVVRGTMGYQVLGGVNREMAEWMKNQLFIINSLKLENKSWNNRWCRLYWW